MPFDEQDVLDVPLGDLMRGERATLGKSLLDVERELKIKAAHIAAIENADLSVFSTKGFVAGYVRSYARYLGMDPEWTFRRFSEEAGFYGVHGESALQAKKAKRSFADAPQRVSPNDVMSTARVSFAPEPESLLSRLGTRRARLRPGSDAAGRWYRLRRVVGADRNPAGAIRAGGRRARDRHQHRPGEAAGMLSLAGANCPTPPRPACRRWTRSTGCIARRRSTRLC